MQSQSSQYIELLCDRRVELMKGRVSRGSTSKSPPFGYLLLKVTTRLTVLDTTNI